MRLRGQGCGHSLEHAAEPAERLERIGRNAAIRPMVAQQESVCRGKREVRSRGGKDDRDSNQAAGTPHDVGKAIHRC